MSKSLYIAEKPSVARQFAEVLGDSFTSRDGHLESDNSIVTWCVGHLISMSYPEAYDEKYKKWRFDTLPFLPERFKYEVIPSAAKQFKIVSNLLNRPDVDVIYVCTDSGREGEYIYRLVDQEAHVTGKTKKRVWIDSQTRDEILRGIREAKDISAYDNLSDAAYLRAKEDYLMGINFSRALSLKYARNLADVLGLKFTSIPVGRVMTCVLGMVVRREREIREFVKQPFYKVNANLMSGDCAISCEWKVCEKSRYFGTPYLYKENGFNDIVHAKELVEHIAGDGVKQLDFDENNVFTIFDGGGDLNTPTAIVENVEKKKEKKNPPLLYNLAELQNDCSKLFKISPDETLNVVQELYEKKLCTYPRTDARVLSSAVAKEIGKNLAGLSSLPLYRAICEEILNSGSYKTIGKTRYTNDKQITDHYAIIPTGQGLSALKTLSTHQERVFEVICRRFLAIFMESAEYQKVAISVIIKNELFSSNFKMLLKPGYLDMMKYSFSKNFTPGQQGKAEEGDVALNNNADESGDKSTESDEIIAGENTMRLIESLKNKDELAVSSFAIKEGETKPPKRYNSGSIILAMENAGQLIEDEELRSQIKGSGIGTSATRAEILKKLVDKKSLNLNKKTQILTPTLMGEITYDIVNNSIRSLLSPELTASWEKGLTGVAEGSISEKEYMEKLSLYVSKHTVQVKGLNNQNIVKASYAKIAQYYEKKGGSKKKS